MASRSPGSSSGSSGSSSGSSGYTAGDEGSKTPGSSNDGSSMGRFTVYSASRPTDEVLQTFSENFKRLKTEERETALKEYMDMFPELRKLKSMFDECDKLKDGSAKHTECMKLVVRDLFKFIREKRITAGLIPNLDKYRDFARVHGIQIAGRRRTHRKRPAKRTRRMTKRQRAK